MKKIPLTQGKFALVDDNDFDLTAQYKWCAVTNRSAFPNIYAVRNRPRPEHGLVLMHRELLGFPKGEVDHIDGNGLNNQRLNLRVCTRQQNACNQRPRYFTGSGVKGVYWQKGAWVARIQSFKEQIFIGRFSTVKEAAEAYNNAAKAIHGEYARLNQL